MNKLKVINSAQSIQWMLLSFVFYPLSLLANLPPVAISDQHYTYKNETVEWTVSDNDSDPNGDPLTYTVLVPPPANKGTWNLNPDGTYEFIPFPFTWGPVNMTYQVCDPGGLCATATLTMYVIFINDEPIINNDSFYVPGNAPFQGNVSSNDIEPDGEVMFYTVMLQPAHGTLTMGQFGAFTYTPQNGYQGPDQFIVNGCDPCQACFNSTAFITVGPPNSAPVAANASFSGPEDTQLTGTLVGLASDPNGDALVFSKIQSPASGNLTINANGTFTFIPALNYFGVLTATYQACDPFGACASAQITITITAVNDAPVAVEDFFTMDEDGVLNGSVATNDYDVDGDVLSYTVLSMPAVGVLSMGASGLFNYTPPANYFGSVQAMYSVTDPSGLSSTANLFISVNSLNDAPQCNDVVVNINKNNVFNGNVSFNDVDPDGDVLTYQVITGPMNGVLQMQANGNCVYTPNYNYFGTETMVYRATDSFGQFDEAQLIVNVIFTDSGPVAQADFFTTLEDEPVAGDISLNDVEPDDEVMTFQLTTQPTSGSIVFNANGTFVYTPALDFNGVVQLNYVVTDPAGNADTAVLTITVTAVNDAPVCGSFSTTSLEDNPFAGQFIASDVDGDALSYSAVFTGQVNGSFNSQSGAFSFVPNQDFFGNIQVNFTTTDPSGLQCSGVWTINILPINDAPVCSDNFFTGLEDVTISGSVASNDFDVDDAVLTYTVIQQPAHGNFNLASNGTFTYLPNLNFHGADQAVYRATDAEGLWDEATVHFTVSPVNDTPTASNQTFNMFWNESFAATVVALDVDGDALSFQLTTSPAGGSFVWGQNGNFTYTPDANFYGVEQLTATVCDAALCATFVITVNVFSENVAPVAIDDVFNGLEDGVLTGSVATNDFDLNNDVLTYTIVQAPSFGTLELASSGAFTYTPLQDWFGTQTAQYQVCDTQGACNVATLTIQLSAVNDAPVASGTSVTFDEDTVLSGTLQQLALDVDGDALTFSMVSGSSFGVLAVQPNGNFTFTPAQNFNGTASFTWQVCDASGLCSSAVMSLVILTVNDAPVANNDIKVIAEDNIANGNVMLNDFDVDGDLLTATVLVGPSQGVFNLNSTTGAYTYTPSLHFNGIVQVVYQVCDPSGLCSSATLTITVIWMNDTPVAVADYLEMNHNQSASGDLSANDYDVDIEPLYYSALNGPFNGTLALDTNGTFVYTPNFNFVGTDMVTYMVCDSCNACAVSNLFITINFLNNPPMAEDDFFTMGKNTSLMGSVSDNDSDPQNDQLIFTLVSSSVNGEINFESDGSFVFTPNLQFFGTVVLTYTVCDIYDACAEGAIIIEVLNVNSPPVFTAPIILSCEGNTTVIHLEDCIQDAESPFENMTFQNISSTTGQVTISMDGNLVYEPEENYTGPVSIFFEVCDNDSEMPLCAESELSFEVNPVFGNITLTDVLVTDVLCHGDSSGSLSLFVDPIVADLYNWSNGATTSELGELSAGIYSVVISSSSVCLNSLEAEFEITEPDAPISVTGLEALPINSSAGGSTIYEVTGGTAPYSFVWTNISGDVISVSQILDGLATADLQGFYTLTVTDSNGCQYTETILVTGVQEQNGDEVIAIYPNPSVGIFRFSMPVISQSIRLTVYDASGRVIKNQVVAATDQFDVDLNGEASGYYTYLMRTDNSVFRGVLVKQ